MKKVSLKKNEERRIKEGHLWVFSNELETKAQVLTELAPGECVTVVSARGEVLGSGYINPHTLLAIRLYSRQGDCLLDADLLKQRLERALAMRMHYVKAPYYRLCFSEGDFLPGIIIDRFQDILVVQLTTQGAYRVKAELTAVLQDLLQPRGILLKNDQANLSLEGLTPSTEILAGQVPEELLIYENDIPFYVPLLQGQKTGWFYDQRANRQRLQPWVQGKTVLDVFAYLGSFGIYAGHYGAKQLTFVDGSKFAGDYIHKNLALNQLSSRSEVLVMDAFDALKQFKTQGRKFDVVLVDPPAFMKRKKDVKAGFLAYQRVNELALDCLAHQGILVSSSCSMHLSATSLLEAIQRANKNRYALQILAATYQDLDHPWHPSIPETQYLKSIFLSKNKY